MIRDKAAEVVVMSPDEFRGLPEYSSTVPTGVFVGKCWKRNEFGVWWMGEYARHQAAPLSKCEMNYYRIVIRERTFPIAGATYYAYWYGDGEPGTGDGHWMSPR